MAINPNIALSFQAPKFDDPINKLAQVEQLKAYRQNALAKQMEMDAAIREREMTNALRQRLASGKELGLSEAAQFGKQGIETYTGMTTARKAEIEALKNRISIGREMLRSIPDTQEGYASFRNKYVFENPDLADYFPEPSQFKPGVNGTLDRLTLSANEINENRRAQETVINSAKQNLFNQINSLSSKVVTTTPEGIKVEDPYAKQQYFRLLNLAAANYPEEYSKLGIPAPTMASGPSILGSSVGGQVKPTGARSKPDDVLRSLVGGRQDESASTSDEETSLPGRIAEAKATQAGARKAAELNAQAQQDKKSNINMANQMLNFIGYKEPKEGEPQQETNVERLIRGSTSGSLQAKAADFVGGLTGTATEGMEKIGALKQLETTLTKDFLGGKLGGGISDADRAMISQMIAEIGNPEIPENQRRAGFKSLIKVLTTIKNQGYYLQPKTVVGEQPSASSAKPEKYTPGYIEDGYRFKGGDPANSENWEEVK